MSDKWWWNKVWVVRANGHIARDINIGDQFWLEPNTTDGEPLFFWFRLGDYNGCHARWKDAYFYRVGNRACEIPMLPIWDPKNECVCETYNDTARMVRASAGNPHTLRLEGRILVDDCWEDVRLFFFQGAQENGKDWAVIDILFHNETTLQDGTAHGEPP